MEIKPAYVKGIIYTNLYCHSFLTLLNDEKRKGFSKTSSIRNEWQWKLDQSAQVEVDDPSLWLNLWFESLTVDLHFQVFHYAFCEKGGNGICVKSFLC